MEKDSFEFKIEGEFVWWIKKRIKPSSIDTPSTTYFMIRKSDYKIIGSIQLRHYLTDELLKDGGNVGDGICPSEGVKRYGTK